MTFTFERILFFDQNSKRITILATKDSQKAILLFEKLQFEESKANSSLVFEFNTEAEGGNSKIIHQNDIYTSLMTKNPFDSHQFDSKVTVIFPATEAHILKYSTQARFLILETPKLYQEVILPFIHQQTAANPQKLQWLYNILDNGQEADRVIFKDDCPQTGFYLLPDTKWDCQNLTSLYLLAICKRKDIFSLRSLTSEHLPLLKRMQSQIPSIIESKWPEMKANKLRMFLHYHPTYYHFHLHIVNIQSEFTDGILIGQAHLLQSVIDNIETFGSDFYAKCTLPFIVGEQQPLYSEFFLKAPNALSQQNDQ